MKPAAKSLKKLSQSIGEMADALQTFQFNNKPYLSQEQWDNIGFAYNKLSVFSQYLLTESAGDILKDVQGNLKNLQQATDNINKSLAKIKTIKDTITITASVVALGTAVVTRDPGIIISAMGGVIGSINDAQAV